jgi:uncharacterized caspase-like protein
MYRRSLLNLIVPAALLLGCSSALAESRLALVIGQSAYRSVPALPNPGNDAKAMSQLLSDSGFEVLSASDLSQSQIRDKVSEFAGKVAEKGPDSVALVFYAGHGIQIDGENYLMPIDVDPKREADIPLQAVRLNDILNALTYVPNKMRILLLDACRNNPFPELNKTAGHGLALVDTKVGSPGTFLSFSTSLARKPRMATAPTVPTRRRCSLPPRSRDRSRRPSSESASPSTRRPMDGRRRGTALR